MTDNLIVGAYRFLSAHPEVQAMVDEGLLGSDEKYPEWVFRNSNGDPARPIEGSGVCGIVVMRGGYWAAQNQHNTAQFPVLKIMIFADNTRDATGVSLAEDAADKCEEVYQRLNKVLHDPAHNISKFGDVRIHSILNGSPFVKFPMYGAKGDATSVGTATYNIITD